MLFLVACGGGAQKLCDKTAECDPDVDVDECMEEFEEFEAAAKEERLRERPRQDDQVHQQARRVRR